MRALLLLAVLVLAACTPFGEATQPHRYFLLEPDLAGAELTFHVSSVTSATFYDTDAMVYSRSSATRGYYQRNSWTEVPARRIAEVVRQRSSGKGPAVSLHLLELYHDASRSPGKVHVALEAEAGGERKTFATEAPAASFDAAGAVKGFNAATGALLQEVERWSVSAAR